MENINNPAKKSFTILIIGFFVITLIVGGAGYWYGLRNGYGSGYRAAESDIKKTQEEIAKKTMEQTIKTANPFKLENPLKGIETNPFIKLKKVLNPFEE